MLLKGKSHLLRLLQEIPPGEADQAAVEDVVTAYENLLAKLPDLPPLLAQHRIRSALA